ncbi:hypothetical protein [Massilia sp. KIM]|uniref:MutS-related protein n=1 Tax=Massilia sp. KIM TaxID=1955422 RepID=UPI001E5D6925|nr:hypothetical protein [Massilia sp. KIM]
MSLFDHLQDLWRRLAGAGVQEPPACFFTPDEVGRLYRTGAPESSGIDDQTWKDLLLGDYEARLAEGVSIFGRQALHRRLRAGMEDAGCAVQRERLQALMDDLAALEALRQDLRVLRHADAEVAGLLFEPTPVRVPMWARWLWVLPLALLLALAATITQPLGWIAPLAVLAPLMALQIHYHRRIEAWSGSLKAINALLASATALGGKDGPLREAFAGLAAPARRLHLRLGRSLLLRRIPGGRQYADWFGAANLGHYFKTARMVDAERALLRACYLACAELEADLALARHLLASPRWCWAGRGGPRKMVLEEGVHPLMHQPAALSVQLEGRGAFVSGQNASGKSTFLRMVGLNLVAARAFGFCYAARACLPALPVRASMQNEDSLLGGESLYMAELRRARELLEASRDAPGICLIDEVFRGTNHLESVSAAAAVLEQLAGRELVLVSSHNLVLASLLREHLDAFTIGSEQGRPALKEGVLRNPNGIALLATQGFGPEIEEKAAQVARWLSGHLGQAAVQPSMSATPA